MIIFQLFGNGTRLKPELTKTAAQFPTVCEWLSEEACARMFALTGACTLNSLWDSLKGDTMFDGSSLWQFDKRGLESCPKAQDWINSV
jgi:hypothetical protein